VGLNSALLKSLVGIVSFSGPVGGIKGRSRRVGETLKWISAEESQNKRESFVLRQNLSFLQGLNERLL
jgi:hypothetical protein